MSETKAPEFIAADTYTGRYTKRSPQASGVFTARELATKVGTVIVLWEFHGHVAGQPIYGRTRFVGQSDGSLVGYNSDGARTIIHPAARKIRVITR